MEQQHIRDIENGPVSLNLNLNLRVFSFIGLILIIFYAFLGRGLYFKPELLTGLVVISAVFAFAVADIAVRGETDFYRFPVDYLITAMVLVYLLSVFEAVSRPDAILGALKYIAYSMAFFITCQSVRTWRSYRGIMEFLFAGTVTVALIGLLSATGHLVYPGAYYQKVIQSTLQYKNALAIFMAAGALICLALWVFTKKSLLQDLWYIEGLLAINIVLLGTQSRAVWMMYPVLLILLIIGLQNKERSRIFLPICYVLLASLLISRWFFARVETGQGGEALSILLGGILVTIAGWLIIRSVNRVIKRKTMAPAVKKFWQGVGVFYLAAVLAVYGYYSVKYLPGGWDTVVPAAVNEKLPTVTSSNPNFQARLLYSRDALKIIKVYPLSGAGAEGWKTLYHRYRSEPYATEEIHNGFLQVAVDTGIPGFLIYTAIWVVTLHSAYRLLKNFRKDPQWPLIWGVMVTLFAILLHSSFDFDLSFPALSIFTWTLFGLIRNGRLLARRNVQGADLRRGLRWLLPLLGVTMAVLVSIFSYGLYRAGELGAEGAQAMAAGETAVAEKKMREAIMKDPYSGTYLADLAKINMVYWLKDGDQERLQRGLDMARQAVQKEPHNIRLRESLIKCYLSAGEIDAAISEAERLVDVNPLEIKAYEVLAGAGLEGAMYYRQKGGVERAMIYLDKVVGIPVKMEERKNQVARNSGKAYRYIRFLEMTPRLNLAVGQAYLLTDNKSKGIPLLEKAILSNDVGMEAAAWLVVAYRNNGAIGKAGVLAREWMDRNEKFNLLIEKVEKTIKR